MLCVILSSCPPADAERIAKHLVAERVAACVSAIPGAVSTYRWQGPNDAGSRVQQEAETLLLIKTPADRVDACMTALRAVHPYTVPEMVVLAAERVADSYLAWAVAECSPTPAPHHQT